MTTPRVFKSGNSQTGRLPRERRFAADEVEISCRGDEVELHEKRSSPVETFRLLASLPEDLMNEGRRDEPAQDRVAANSP